MVRYNVFYFVLTTFLLAFSGCHSVNTAGYDGKTVADTSSTGGNNIPDGDFHETEITVCTFNIQFLGAFKKRDNSSLSDLLKNYDLVVVQELVAPPVSGIYPDGSGYTADPEAKAFSDSMASRGFKFLLSEEDTGTGQSIHSAGTGTEWFICFYDSLSLKAAPDLPHGFVAGDRSDNPDYERVPCAFAFRTVMGKNDFVVISVHLNPGDKQADQARRKHEVASAFQWISTHNQVEKDFIILGDMNIENKNELTAIMPDGMKSLNDECRVTNTLINNTPPDYGGKPYDQIFYFPAFSNDDIDTAFDCEVIDLKKLMKSYWKGPDPYPGDPYIHDLFRQYYSDHNPLIFKIRILDQDDD
jgi:hypothetical protein